MRDFATPTQAFATVPPAADHVANGKGQLELGLLIPIVLLAAAIGGLLVNDPLGSIAIIVLATGWRLLQQPDGPPVLRIAFTYHWMQVSIGVFYFGVTGRYSPTIALSDYRPMVLIGLGSVSALFGGIALVNRFTGEGRRGGTTPWMGLTNRDLVLLYLVSLVGAGAVLQAGKFVPGLLQAATVLTLFRYAPLYLAFHRLASPRFRASLFIPLLAFEVALGFTGYFANFREPIVFATLALLQNYDVRKVRHSLVLAAITVSVTALAITWTVIKPEYRSAFDTVSDSRAERVDLLRVLVSRFAGTASEQAATGVDATVDRLWTVYYPALAVERVPEVVPHTAGEQMWTGIRHILMPRLFFPGKPGLISNSIKVREFSGANVAGEEEGTSIAFGYAAELYVDFGVPMMFVPVFVAGLALATAFRRVRRLMRHHDLAIAVSACIVWFSLSQFEQSWARLLGWSLTLILAMGGTGFLIDRYMSRRHRRLAALDDRYGA